MPGSYERAVRESCGLACYDPETLKNLERMEKKATGLSAVPANPKLPAGSNHRVLSAEGFPLKDSRSAMDMKRTVIRRIMGALTRFMTQGRRSDTENSRKSCRRKALPTSLFCGDALRGV